MANRNLDALYITRPVSIAYLTGFEANPHERLMALAVRSEEATRIVPSLEEEKAHARATNVDILAWRDGEDAYELVRRALAGLTELGVEKEHLSLGAAEVITSRTGASELVDVGPEVRRLRLIKDDDEIEKLQRAAAITDETYEVVLSQMRAGQTEIDVATRIGHGLGREAHEDPSLDPGSGTVLEPGMVFTIEPGIYIAGWGGVRIEDDVVVQENGCRVLTQADRSLRVIPST